MLFSPPNIRTLHQLCAKSSAHTTDKPGTDLLRHTRRPTATRGAIGFPRDHLEVIIIDFTQADIHGTKFEPDRVWVAATRRLRSRLMAHEANMIRKARAHRSRGWKPPTIGAPNLQAGPLLEYRHDECEGPWGCDLTCTPAQHLTGLYDELQIL